MTNDHGDAGAPSSAASGPPADRPRQCTTCGGRIALEEWHPVVARTDGDDTFQLYAFCSEDCRQDWNGG